MSHRTNKSHVPNRKSRRTNSFRAIAKRSRWVLPDDAFAASDGSEQVGLSILKQVEPAKVEWIAEGRAPRGRCAWWRARRGRARACWPSSGRPERAKGRARPTRP